MNDENAQAPLRPVEEPVGDLHFKGFLEDDERLVAGSSWLHDPVLEHDVLSEEE
ncbi:hypothetical protein [Schaalia hyovaginalis]|uniref:hypothetical protein n=1 Tax=Schaalia hyovaginalis TaxID=29316 RepID=UPI002A74778C|nr:hypothetical protein [Schaalia hyovaginalis]MDY2669189.1 hypothetical protein [Schaalia hyovaginalis]